MKKLLLFIPIFAIMSCGKINHCESNTDSTFVDTTLIDTLNLDSINEVVVGE